MSPAAGCVVVLSFPKTSFTVAGCAVVLSFPKERMQRQHSYKQIPDDWKWTVGLLLRLQCRAPGPTPDACTGIRTIETRVTNQKSVVGSFRGSVRGYGDRSPRVSVGGVPVGSFVRSARSLVVQTFRSGVRVAVSLVRRDYDEDGRDAGADPRAITSCLRDSGKEPPDTSST